MNHESRTAMETRIRKLERAYQEALQENVGLRREIEQLKRALPHPQSGSTVQKIQLFRSWFRGRDDVYALRWDNSRNGKSGYRLALKTRGTRPPYEPTDLLPLTDAVIYQHLKGDETVGRYPLLPTEETWFLAIDFDKSEWHHDALAYLNTCRQWGVPAALERSRSGNGAHVWTFFEVPVAARLARRLGTGILTEASHNMGRPRLESYDRFFPNQDTMPAGGFGNLIALPLQGAAAKAGNTQFIQDDGTPWPDQWEYLRSLPRMSASQLADLVAGLPTEWEALGLATPLHTGPSARPVPRDTGTFPMDLPLTVTSRVEVPTAALPKSLIYELIRLAAFPNPEFFRRQRLHFSTWNTPRVLSVADESGDSLFLPRSLLDDAVRVLTEHGIRPVVQDQRVPGAPISVQFTPELNPEQQRAVEALTPHESGVLDAATGFGKTIVAASLIAQRQVNTLVLVPNLQLVSQWQEHLTWALAFDPPNAIGQWSGSKKKAGGIVDIATLQTVSRESGASLLAHYGFLILDECHHLASPSFESILRNSPSRYRLGLSATPLRRDGHHPIIFMHLGPIRFTYETKAAVNQSPYAYRVRPRITPLVVEEDSLPIQEIYRRLSDDALRNQLIADDVKGALGEGRYPLVLTQRTSQRDHLAELLQIHGIEVIILMSQPSAKRRAQLQSQLAALSPAGGWVILATGRLAGEGFDLPRLDTLFLAAPVSWRSVLQQYVGRLHRRHPDKQTILVYDYVDSRVPQLARMYKRRASSYRSFGYHIEEP